MLLKKSTARASKPDYTRFKGIPTDTRLKINTTHTFRKKHGEMDRHACSVKVLCVSKVLLDQQYLAWA